MCSPCNNCAKGLAKGLITALISRQCWSKYMKYIKAVLQAELRSLGKGKCLRPSSSFSGGWCVAVMPGSAQMAVFQHSAMDTCNGDNGLMLGKSWSPLPHLLDTDTAWSWWCFLPKNVILHTHTCTLLCLHFIFAEIQVKEKEGGQCSLESYFRYVMVSDSWWPKTLCCLQGIWGNILWAGSLN